jgi:hypothetical protein
MIVGVRAKVISACSQQSYPWFKFPVPVKLPREKKGCSDIFVIQQPRDGLKSVTEFITRENKGNLLYRCISPDYCTMTEGIAGIIFRTGRKNCQ